MQMPKNIPADEDAEAVGRAIDEAVRGLTVPHLFARTVERRADEVALRWRTGDEYASWTWRDYRDRACAFAGGLRELGVGRGDRVMLMMSNRAEFHVADLGAQLAGAVPLSIYNTSAPEQIVYLANQCGAAVAVAGGPAFLDRFLAVRDRLETVQHLLTTDPDDRTPSGVRPFERLLAAAPVDLDRALAEADPADLVTLLYTSGTTGPPKGVMLTHANICWSLESLHRSMRLPISGWRTISYLPMAHISDRMINHYLHMSAGTEVTICPDPTRYESYLLDVRPHCVGAVPRTWEKLHARMSAAVDALPDADAARVRDALELGRHRMELLNRTGEVPHELDERWAEAEVEALAPVKATVGLDACRVAFSGGAPLPRHIFDYVLSLGIPLTELLGMTESPMITGWDFRAVRAGTVGRPAPGVQARILPDGELVLRGGQLSPGYFEDPVRTAETFDADGWLHTGDVVEDVGDGYLRVVDRKKELIITSSGKNVSPAAIENELKRLDLVGQVAVIGNNRPYITALVVLDPVMAPAWAVARGLPANLATLAGHPECRAEIERGVAAVNARLSRPEQIKRFLVLDHEWTPDSDELTPSMKLKRRNITARYRREIDSLYAERVTTPA